MPNQHWPSNFQAPYEFPSNWDFGQATRIASNAEQSLALDGGISRPCPFVEFSKRKKSLPVPAAAMTAATEGSCVPAASQ